MNTTVYILFLATLANTYVSVCRGVGHLSQPLPLSDPTNAMVVQLVGAVEEGPEEGLEEGPESPLSAREKLLQ